MMDRVSRSLCADSIEGYRILVRVSYPGERGPETSHPPPRSQATAFAGSHGGGFVVRRVLVLWLGILGAVGTPLPPAIAQEVDEELSRAGSAPPRGPSSAGTLSLLPLDREEAPVPPPDPVPTPGPAPTPTPALPEPAAAALTATVGTALAGVVPTDPAGPMPDDLKSRGVLERHWKDPTFQQMLLNARAFLMMRGLWSRVTEMSISAFETRTWKFGPLKAGKLRKFTFRPADGDHEGWEIALVLDPSVRGSLILDGYLPQWWNHPEARWQLKRNHGSLTAHFLGLKKPYHRYTLLHFDDSNLLQHLRDNAASAGFNHDTVTRVLLQDPQLHHYLLGISPQFDERFAPR